MQNIFELAYYANNVIENQRKNEFGLLIDDAIDRAGLKKKNVADEAGIHPTSLSRIISGEIGAARPTAIALVDAINKLANREVLNPNAIEKAGHSSGEAFASETINLGEDVRVQLLNAKNMTEEDKAEYARDFMTAYEIAKRRIEEKKKKNESP